jgi:hypothetical protein
MIVSFATSALTALCNSGDALSRRWGPDVATRIGRRLYDLAAATADTITHIPDTSITVDDIGDATITFGGMVVVHGIIERGRSADPKTATEGDHILITSLDVHESDRR